MTTSEGKSSRHSAIAMPILARDVGFGDATLVVSLEDGRQISVPIAWFPRLAAAMDAHSRELDNWRLIGGGIGIHWPDLDEDISVENLLAKRDELLTYHDVPGDDGEHRRQAHVSRRSSRANRAAASRVLRDPRTGRFQTSATPPPTTL